MGSNLEQDEADGEGLLGNNLFILLFFSGI